jgi:hypothetical protein
MNEMLKSSRMNLSLPSVSRASKRRLPALSTGLLGLLMGAVLAPVGVPSLAAAEKEEPALRGPSFQLSLGARFKGVPELDRYDSPTVGLKAAPLGFRTGSHSYLTLLGLGVNYIGDNRVAFSLTPLAFFHEVGVGLAIDLYTTRPDRSGGPYGVSLNFDLLQLANAAMAFAGR